MVHHPERDRLGNGVPTVLGERYDAFLSFDETTALHPLITTARDRDEQQTYPWSA